MTDMIMWQLTALGLPDAQEDTLFLLGRHDGKKARPLPLLYTFNGRQWRPVEGGPALPAQEPFCWAPVQRTIDLVATFRDLHVGETFVFDADEGKRRNGPWVKVSDRCYAYAEETRNTILPKGRVEVGSVRLLVRRLPAPQPVA